jgi:hypothetical protein
MAAPKAPKDAPRMAGAALAAGLVEAQRHVGRVGKEGKNAHHGYRYATAEDMIDEARAALSAGGLALIARSHDIEDWVPSPVTDERGQLIREDREIAVRITYSLTHASGEALEIVSRTPVMPEKGRPWDKALAVAKTYDLAYTLRSLLLIPRGDDGGGVDQRDDAAWRRGAPAPAAAPPAKRRAPRLDHDPETGEVHAPPAKPAPEPAPKAPPKRGPDPAPDPEINAAKRELAKILGRSEAASLWAADVEGAELAPGETILDRAQKVIAIVRAKE